MGRDESHHTSTQRSPVTAEGAGSVQMMWTKSAMDSDSKRLRAGEKATPKLTLVAPPDGAQSDCPSVVHGVARLLTTTTMGDTPVSMAAVSSSREICILVAHCMWSCGVLQNPS